MAGPALLANVLVSKYCDHIPLHRLARIHARDGVCFDPSTYGVWVEQSHALLDPLVAALGRYAPVGVKVHADDTPVPVVDRGRGRTKTGRLSVYVRDDRQAGSTEPPAAWYRYSPNRKGEHLGGNVGCQVEVYSSRTHFIDRLLSKSLERQAAIRLDGRRMPVAAPLRAVPGDARRRLTGERSLVASDGLVLQAQLDGVLRPQLAADRMFRKRSMNRVLDRGAAV